MSQEGLIFTDNINSQEEKPETKNGDNEQKCQKNNSNSQIIFDCSLGLGGDDKSKRKNKKQNSSDNISVKTLNIIRVFAIIVIFSFCAITILSIMIYESKDKHTNYVLLCFVFQIDSYYPFHTSIYAFYLYILLLLFQTFASIYYIFWFHLEEIKKYLTKSIWIINAILITLSIEFLVGDYMARTYKFDLIHLIFSGIGVCLSGWIYFETRLKMYIKITLLIAEYFLSGSLFAFECYILLFNICDFLTKTPNDPESQTKHKEHFNIMFNMIYFLIGLISLTIYKDMVFPIILIIIEMGLLMNPKYSFWEILSSVSVSLFVFYALVYTVLKNQKELFRYKNANKFKMGPLIEHSMLNQ